MIYERELRTCPALNGLRGQTDGTNGAVERADAGGDDDKEVVIEGVDVWVTSEYALFTFAATYSSGSVKGIMAC